MTVVMAAILVAVTTGRNDFKEIIAEDHFKASMKETQMRTAALCIRTVRRKDCNCRSAPQANRDHICIYIYIYLSIYLFWDGACIHKRRDTKHGLIPEQLENTCSKMSVKQIGWKCRRSSADDNQGSRIEQVSDYSLLQQQEQQCFQGC